MNHKATVPLIIGVLLSSVVVAAEPEAFPLNSDQIQQRYQQLCLAPIDLKVPSFASDASVKYDYDIVYVRAPRFGDEGKTTWTEVSHPHRMDPGADLALLHPDGSEEVLLIKNDPKYNEQWPRPLVPYKRIYGIDQPKEIKPIKNDGCFRKRPPRKHLSNHPHLFSRVDNFGGVRVF